MSESADPLDPACPQLDYRWLHGGVQHLSLLSTPVVAAKVVTYATFSDLENDRLEEAFDKLTASQRKLATRKMGEWKETIKDGPNPFPGSNDQKVKNAAAAFKGKSDVIVGDGVDTEPAMKGKQAAEAEKYPDPDDQPIEANNEEEVKEKDYDSFSGVPVAQVGLACEQVAFAMN